MPISPGSNLDALPPDVLSLCMRGALQKVPIIGIMRLLTSPIAGL
jgi:hypothetical protein